MDAILEFLDRIVLLLLFLSLFAGTPLLGSTSLLFGWSSSIVGGTTSSNGMWSIGKWLGGWWISGGVVGSRPTLSGGIRPVGGLAT